MKLGNQVAIVTGAGSGFGEGIAKTYAREGAAVVVNDINEQGGRRVVREIEDAGGKAHFVYADVTRNDDVAAMVEEAAKRYGGVSVMVNNAGYTHVNQPMTEVTEEEFDRTYAVNVKAIFLAAKHVVPRMRAAGGGVIINTASTAGIRPRPGLVWYNGSKGAAITITKTMAAELAKDNIRVNAICPVIGATGMLERFMGVPDTPENRARFVATIPLGRMSTPEDIANAALFLAQPSSSFITGVCLEVDGGRCI